MRVLAELHRREVRALLVEGGAEIHGAFLAAGLVDRVAVFVAPAPAGRPAGRVGHGWIRARRSRDALRLADLSRPLRRRRPAPGGRCGEGGRPDVHGHRRRGRHGAELRAGDGQTARLEVDAGADHRGQRDRRQRGRQRRRASRWWTAGPTASPSTSVPRRWPSRPSATCAWPDRVNLERPLRFGGSLGGHLVLGHVDGVGTVAEVTRVESTARIRIALWPIRPSSPCSFPRARWPWTA